MRNGAWRRQERFAIHGATLRSLPRLTRRAFLAGAAASAAFGHRAVDRAAGARDEATPVAGQPRTGIVGAGIAGLHAALTLHDAGIAATIFEAAERVGGRMHSNTETWAEGQTSEWCGELIDTGHTTIQGLAARFRLPLVDVLAAEPAGARSALYFSGRYYPEADIDHDFAAVYPILRDQVEAIGPLTRYDLVTPEGRRFDNTSIAQWIDDYVPGGHDSSLGKLLSVVSVTENGREPAEASALSLIYPLAESPELFGFSDERFHISGGNQQLPQAIAAYLTSNDPRGELRLGWRMTAIRRDAGGVVLSFATAQGLQEERFDRVLLALPFSVLRTLDYTNAGFDALKRRAITELTYGTNAKLQVQCATRFWREVGPWPTPSNGGISTDIGMQNAWEVTRGQLGEAGIINIYTGGLIGAGFYPEGPYTTSESPATRDAARRFLALLDQVWPGASAHYTGAATLSYPAGDPNLLGSYPTYAVGQVTAFGGYEAVPQGPIHFAGDHCSLEYQGFMEGAARSGASAAEAIVARYVNSSAPLAQVSATRYSSS